MNSHFWKKNDLYYGKYKELAEHIEKLDIFEYTGAISIILQDAEVEGVIHTDHLYKDLVSEFIWIRFNNDK